MKASGQEAVSKHTQLLVNFNVPAATDESVAVTTGGYLPPPMPSEPIAPPQPGPVPDDWK